ncbi:hypothetical protein C0993_002461, partial [Termitomyces sp. T159_Od127]
SDVLRDSFLKLEDLPPIELPSPPPLYTRRRDVGDQHVPLQVLGWAKKMEELSDWTDKHCPRPNSSENNKRIVALRNIPAELPEGHRRHAPVRDPAEPRRLKWCFAVATNKTQEDMDRGKDMALIDAFRVALDCKTAPQWYRVYNVQYVWFQLFSVQSTVPQLYRV